MACAKVAIVTGSNKGIGYAIVKNLLKQFDGTVYLTARDETRGKEAVNSLVKLGLKPEFHLLDVDDNKSICTFADFIKEKHGGIDVLVNNAAISFKLNSTVPFGEQAEVTIRTNFYALNNVCNALFPLLRPHARVVNLSSSAGFLKRLPSEELQKKLANPDIQFSELEELVIQFLESAKRGDHEKDGWPSAYSASKIFVSTLSRIQHREILKDSREDIVINHVHPGYVKTDMTSHQGVLSVEQGADAATYLALLPAGTTSPKGDYVWHNREIIDWVNGPVPAKY